MSIDNTRQVGFRPALDVSQGRFRQFPAQPVTPMGYAPGDGQAPRAVQGDDLGPYVVVPPDLAEARIYRPRKFLQATDNLYGLEILPALDVRGARTVSLYIDYDGASGAGGTITTCMQSAMVFEGQDNEQWVNQGVVNPVLWGSGLYGVAPEVSFAPPAAAFRDVFIGQLDWSVASGFAATIMLTFDVQPCARVRFLLGSTSRTGGVPAVDINAALYVQLGR